MSTERKFQGVWIPAAIWLDRSLSITEKVMLVEINSLEKPDRGCYAGNEYFSGFFDLSKSRVSEIISGLVAKNLVRVVLIREGKQIVGRQIWMTESGRLLTEGVLPSSENTHTPSSENTHTPIRERGRPSSENNENLFGKGGDPSSEKAKENNTDSNNTKSNTKSNTEILLPEKSGKKKAIPEDTNPSLDSELQAACRTTWKSYSDAYYHRYGIEPIRTAQVNSAIKAFCKKIPHLEAPHVAAFYVRHNDKYYLQKTHHPSLMSKDAEGLRTQWATGRSMTSTKATQLEKTSGNADAVKEAIEMMNARRAHATL